MADVKLIIKIPEEMWERIKDGYVPLGISKYLQNGTPIPDNATKYMKCFECAKAIQGAPIGNMCGKWKCEFEKR